MLTPEVKNAFNQLRRNDVVYFSDIVAQDVSGANISTESVIKININR